MKRKEVITVRNPFRVIAETVRRHERRLLIAWVLVVLVAVPLAIQAREITESSETEFVGHVESVDVENLIEEKFPEVPKAIVSIIIDAKEDSSITMFDPRIQQLIVELENELKTNDAIHTLLNVTTYKSIERDIQNRYWDAMNQTDKQLREVFLNLTLDLIQNVTTLRDVVLSLQDALNLTKNGILGLNQMQYMIPALYEMTWWNLSRAVFYIANLTDWYAPTGVLDVTDLPNLIKVTNATINHVSFPLTEKLIAAYYGATNVTLPSVPGAKLGFILYTSPPNITDALLHNLTYTFSEYALTLQGASLGSFLELARSYLVIYNNTWADNFSSVVQGYHSANGMGNGSNTLFNFYVGAPSMTLAVTTPFLSVINASQVYVLGGLASVNASTFATAVSRMNQTLRALGQNDTADLWSTAAALGMNAGNATRLRELVLGYLGEKLAANFTEAGMPKEAVTYLTVEALPKLYDSGQVLNETLVKNVTLTLMNKMLANASSLFNMSALVGESSSGSFDSGSFDSLAIEDLLDLQAYLSDVYELAVNSSRTSQDVELVANRTASTFIGNLEKNPDFDVPTIEDGSIPREAYSFLMSDDNRTTMIFVTLNATETDPLIEEALAIRKAAHDLVNSNGLADHVNVYVTGSGALEHDLDVAFERDISRVDQVTVILVFALLIIVFGSLVTWSIPLLSIGSALMVALASLWAINNVFGVQIPSMLISMLTVIMFGAGVDYAVFTLARYQEERHRGRSRDEATLLAVEHAGESVTSSGLTVIVGFGSLIVSSFALLRTMGMGPLIGISLSLIAVLTVIPAALFTFGDKLFWPRTLDHSEGTSESSESTPETIAPKRKKKSFFRKSAEFTTRHPVLVIVIFLALSAPFVYNALFNIRPDYDFINLMPSDMESVQGLKVMRGKFPQGRLIPVQIIMEFDTSLQNGTYWNLTMLNHVEDFVKELENIMVEHSYPGDIFTITRPNGKLIPFENLTTLDTINLSLMDQWISRDVDNKTVLIEIQFEKDPLSVDALDVVDAFKTRRDELQQSDGPLSKDKVKILIGGFPSTYSSLRSIMNDDTPLVISVVLIGTFIVLFFLLGSVFSPIRLQFTIGLSVLVTLGITELVFVELLHKSIPWIAPLMIVVILFGLGLDYDIFIVTRMREEVEKGHSDKEAIVIAIENTGRVITAAGVIMASALGALMLAQNLVLQVMGFAFFVAILLDATLIRIFLVPAIMSLFEKWNWWAPGPFQRVKRR